MRFLALALVLLSGCDWLTGADGPTVIRGIVVDEATGEPVDSILVSVTRAPPCGWGGCGDFYIGEPPDVPWRAITDETGLFEISRQQTDDKDMAGFSAGDLRGREPGYKPVEYFLRESAQDPILVRRGKTTELTARMRKVVRPTYLVDWPQMETKTD